MKPLETAGVQVVVRTQWFPREWQSPLLGQMSRRLHSRAVTVLRLINMIPLLRDASSFDVIMMNRDLVPEIKVNFIEPLLAKTNPRLIFDFDDAIHLTSRGNKLRKILPSFAWITAGNEQLASFAREIHPSVSVWPSVVDTEYYRPVKSRRPGPLRIGWSGSHQPMRDYVPMLKGPLMELAKTVDFEFLVISDELPQLDWSGVKWRHIPWKEATEAEDLQEIDIGTMPLRDAAFERGKCGMKAILYMSAGIPALVSPVGANCNIVLDGKTGFHCGSDSEWVAAFRSLVSDENLRLQLGRAGRAHVEMLYSQHCLFPRMIDIFGQVAALNERGRSVSNTRGCE
ncbi:MAG: glycosyltransferase family 4 protein [Verrucomicrobia bacterium]|nr:glycosyltransferase family 4 protein [Verrucomicrobiota bacterium]